jgi:hypothetical protein
LRVYASPASRLREALPAVISLKVEGSRTGPEIQSGMRRAAKVFSPAGESLIFAQGRARFDASKNQHNGE